MEEVQARSYEIFFFVKKVYKDVYYRLHNERH